jgi:all-trans-retinol 13,14-reductase
MTDFDAIVIGSGAGGLSAALNMSKQGASVLVLEARPVFGGYLNAFTRNGYSFDTGVHYLGKLAEGGSFRLLLEHLGIDEELEFVELNPDGFDRYIFPDFELQLCKGRQRYQERLHRLFPNESKAIKKLFHIQDRLITAIANPNGPPKNILEKLLYLIRNPVLARYFRSTYQQMLNSITRNPSLQAALSAHCGNGGLPPNRASAFLSLMLLNHYLDGAFYPKGGSGALRDAFVAGLKKNNAAMRQNAAVERIEKRVSEFEVTTRSKERFTAKTVISNADPLITFRQMVDPDMMPRALKKKVARLRPSAGAFYAFIGTRMDVAKTDLTDANIIHFGHTDVNRCFETLSDLSSTEPFPYYFITSPSLKDPTSRHAPEGYNTLQIITGLGTDHPFLPWSGTKSRNRGKEYDQLKNQIGMQLIRSAERYVPDLSGHLDYVEFATPLSSEYWVNSFQGANFGLEQTPDQFGPGRFFDCTAGIKGLFLVGSGTISSGVLSCMASGVWGGNQALDFLNS